MILDLRKEFSDAYAYLEERIRAFDPSTNEGPGKGTVVKMIELGFQYSQAGWLAVVFDTRPNAEPDGEWTLYIDGNRSERESWLAACEANSEAPITLVQLDGREASMPQWTELAIPLGEMLKAVLFKARADGLFRSLPMAEGCEFGVEHLEGAYGWPAYKDRRKENLA